MGLAIFPKARHPPGRTPPPEGVWMLGASFCAGGGPGTMPTPLSISAFPVRGYSIGENVVRVNTLMQSPLVVAGRPSSAWEDYNYKSSAQVTDKLCPVNPTRRSYDTALHSNGT